MKVVKVLSKNILLLLFLLLIFQCGNKKHKNVLNNNIGKIIFIELGSINCVPCKMMEPVMKEIEKKYPKKVKVIFYDVWTKKDRPMATKYNIRLIPTQIFIDVTGKEFFRHEGFFSKEQIVKLLDKKLNK